MKKASNELGDFLLSLNLPMARLKTGTPPRILKNTIDYSVLEEDLGILHRVIFHQKLLRHIISKFHVTLLGLMLKHTLI